MGYININRFSHFKQQLIIEGFIENEHNFKLIMNKSPLTISIRKYELRKNKSFQPIENLYYKLGINDFQYNYLLETISETTI
jgi:hypothetical protein